VQILAVDGGDQRLASQFSDLREAGYQLTQTATFETAREIMFGGCHIDLLITGLRLRAYNGLHLVSYTRSFCDHTAAIVVDNVEGDSISEFEARRMGAQYLAAPVEFEQLRALVKDTIAAHVSPSEPTALAPASHPSSEHAPF